MILPYRASGSTHLRQRVAIFPRDRRNSSSYDREHGQCCQEDRHNLLDIDGIISLRPRRCPAARGAGLPGDRVQQANRANGALPAATTTGSAATASFHAAGGETAARSRRPGGPILAPVLAVGDELETGRKEVEQVRHRTRGTDRADRVQLTIQGDSFAERRGTLRRECLEHILIFGEGVSARSWPSSPATTTCTASKCRERSDLRVSVNRLRGPVVLVDHAAEQLTAPHRRVQRHDGLLVMIGWSLMPDWCGRCPL